MALKTVLETLEGVDDAIKPFYTEANGNFVLALDGVDSHPDVANLKNAYDRVKDDKAKLVHERDTFKAKVEGIPEDFDPEVWAKAKSGKADEAAIARVQSAYEAKLQEAQNEIAGMKQRMVQTALERDLSDALVGAGVTDPSLSQGARALLAGKVQVNDDGAAFAETPFGPKPLQEFVKMWAGGEGKAFVSAPKGGGSNGGQGAKDGKTVTRAEFDGMSQKSRAQFAKEGGKVVDA